MLPCLRLLNRNDTSCTSFVDIFYCAFGLIMHTFFFTAATLNQPTLPSSSTFRWSYSEIRREMVTVVVVLVVVVVVGCGGLLAGNLGLGLFHELAEHGLHLRLEVVHDGLDSLLKVLRQRADLLLHGGGQRGEVFLDLGHDRLDLSRAILDEGPGERWWETEEEPSDNDSKVPHTPPPIAHFFLLCCISGSKYVTDKQQTLRTAYEG